MGKGARLGRALGAGLETFGKREQERTIREEEKRRFDEQSARAERQLQIQEQDALQRKQMNKFKLASEKAMHNNKMLMQAFAESQGDPRVIGAAMSHYGNTGRVFDYNAKRSAETGGIVYDVGTMAKTKDGGVRVGADGKPEVTPLPLGAGEVVFENQEMLDQHIIKSSNPEFLLAQEMMENKEELLRRNAVQLMVDKLAASDEYYNSIKDTDAGKRFLAEHEAKVEAQRSASAVNRERAATLKQDRENPKPGKGLASQAPVTNIAGAGGGNQGLTDADKQIAIQNQKAFEKQGYEGITVQQSYRMTQLQDDPARQQEIAEGLRLVQSGEWAPSKFRALAKDYKVPAQFFDKLLEETAELDELSSEEAKAGQPGFISKTISVIGKLLNPAHTMAKAVADKVNQPPSQGLAN